MLSERLIAFRDTAGKVGQMDEFCAHRGVSLWFGRNEEHGLRCPDHGLKYDVSGACTEVPSEPAESDYCGTIKLKSYPCVEKGDVIGTYMVPAAPGMRALLAPQRSTMPLYHERVQTTVLHFGRPCSAHALEHALRDTVEQFGEKILRIKGMVTLEGESSAVLVQVVQTKIFPFERLRDKARADSFLVFITMGLAADALRSHFSGMALHTSGSATI